MTWYEKFVAIWFNFGLNKQIGPMAKTDKKQSKNVPAELAGGSNGGRGFHYQDVYGVLLAVRRFVDWQSYELLIPEGSNDYEIQTNDEIFLVEAKSVGEGVSPRMPSKDVSTLKELYKRPVRKNRVVSKYILVMNKAHSSYGAISRMKPVSETQIANNFKDNKLSQKVEKSYLIVESDPFNQACKILVDERKLLPAAAKIVCSILAYQIRQIANENGQRDLEDRQGLNFARIQQIINKVLMVCQIDRVEKLIREGAIKECDFTPSPLCSEFYLSIDVRLGHVTSGQVFNQSNFVEKVEKKLRNLRRCFLTGPSGIGKSAMMWQVVNSTKNIVCWYEVTANSELDSESLTLFLNAVSEQQHIGFVIDNLDFGKSRVLKQLIRNTQGNEQVWILGTMRSENMKLASALVTGAVIEYRADESLAESLFLEFKRNGQTNLTNWKETWDAANQLLLEYVYLLTHGATLSKVVKKQVQTRLVGREQVNPCREDELDILKIVIPVVALGGKADYATVKQAFVSRFTDVQVRHNNGLVRAWDELLHPDNRMAQAMLGLIDEFILSDKESQEIGGLHELRSQAAAEALIENQCLSMKEFATTAIKFANRNTIENVTFNVAHDQLLTESELLSAIVDRSIENESAIVDGAKLGNGIRGARLQRVANNWYRRKFLPTIFPPTMAVLVAFFQPVKQSDMSSDDNDRQLPDDVKNLATELHIALFEKIDSITLPHRVVFNIINSLRIYRNRLTGNNIYEALNTLVGINLSDKYIQQLKRLRLNFDSMNINLVARILDTALEISSEIQEAWIEYANKSSPERPLHYRLFNETAFALPINVLTVNGEVYVEGNFRECIVLEGNPEGLPDNMRRDEEEDEEDSIGDIRASGKPDIDEIVNDHRNKIRAVIPRVHRVTSAIVDVDGNNSGISVSEEPPETFVPLARLRYSNIIRGTIEANSRSGDWSAFLEKEEKLLRNFFECCLDYLNRWCVGNAEFKDIARQFLHLTDKAEKLIPPDLNSEDNSDSFFYTSPLYELTTMLSLPLIRRIFSLPADAEKIVSEVDTALEGIKSIRNQPWEFSQEQPTVLLDEIEKFMLNVKIIVLEALSSGSNPLRLQNRIHEDERTTAYEQLSTKIVNKFWSYHRERQAIIEKRVRDLDPDATVLRSDIEPNASVYTRYVILLHIKEISQWTQWFTNAKSIVHKFLEIFENREDFSVIPVVNGKFAVGYRWENSLERMRYSRIEKYGEISLETNRFLYPSDLDFVDVDFDPRVSNLTVYRDFINLCSLNSYIFEMHGIKSNLKEEFRIYDKAKSLLEWSYGQFTALGYDPDNLAIQTLCDLISKLLEGRDIRNIPFNPLDQNALLTGMAEFIWRSTID